MFRNTPTIGSTLAPKSCNTLANCGSTKVRKNSSTQPAAPSTKSGIADRIRQPPLQRLAARAFAGQHLQHLIQRSRRLADPHQRDIHRRKQPLMPRQRLGKALAGDDARADVGDDRPQPAEIGIGGEQLQPVIDAGAGAQQQREVAGEDGDVFGLRPVEEAEHAARRAALFRRDVVDQHQAEPLDPLRDVAGRRRGDGAGDQFAVGVERAIAIVRHGSTAPS